MMEIIATKNRGGTPLLTILVGIKRIEANLCNGLRQVKHMILHSNK